ncbi:MAG: transcriptional regulator NrdR [bacterium]|nr:transcriptional regulator NrdR [bacterium]
MKCPFCGTDDDRVVDSRSMVEGDCIRRRRECMECKKRFTTYERVEEMPLMIIKKDERREPFERSKIANSIRIACRKRPVSEDQIEEITSRVERQLYNRGDREISSEFVGEAVMLALRDLDQVAYVRFASVYRQFKDVNQFMNELTHLIEKTDLTNVSSSPA